MGKIICFIGADSKCGTTQLALSCAEKTAKSLPDAKVLFLCTQENLGGEYLPRLGESMERIRPYIADGLFDVDEIVKRSEYFKNLHAIGGANQPSSVGYYKPEEVVAFLKALQEYFDYIICDCGSVIDHGLCIGAMLCAVRVYVVLTQTELCIKRLEYKKDYICKLGCEKKQFIINKFSESVPYDAEYLSERLGIENGLFYKVRLSKKGFRAEMTECSLLGISDRGFSRDITNLVKRMINEEV